MFANKMLMTQRVTNLSSKRSRSKCESRNIPALLSTLLISATILFSLPSRTDAAELITNGSFETGNFTGWTTVNAPSGWYNWQIVTAGFNNTFVAPAAPQHGSFDAYQGIASNPGSFLLWQDIAVPAGTASLTWRHRFQLDNDTFCNGPSCGTATYAVEILTTANALLETLTTLTVGPDSFRDTGWVQFQRSLNAYAGQTIRVRFRSTVTATYAGPGQLEIDQVSLQSPSILVPTAANVSISGRVVSPDGSGIRNAIVSVADQTGSTRYTRTNTFGYFALDSVPSGQTYLLGVSAKGWSFQPTTLSVADDVSGIEIVADSEQLFELSKPTPLLKGSGGE